MPQIKKNATLPTAVMPTPATEFDFDEAANELVVTLRFPFNYPDEAIIKRFGRAPKDDDGNLTGEPKPVTQLTYGLGHKIFTGSADANDNPMFLNVRLFAPTKEAGEEEEAGAGTEE